MPATPQHRPRALRLPATWALALALGLLGAPRAHAQADPACYVVNQVLAWLKADSAPIACAAARPSPVALAQARPPEVKPAPRPSSQRHGATHD